MIDRDRLRQAADAGLIDPQRIDALHAFLNADNTEPETAGAAPSSEEPLRFIRSFGDVFITIGVVLLAIAINMQDFAGYYGFIPALGFVAIAEWLVRVRKLALPGIAILLAILFFVHQAVVAQGDQPTVFDLALIAGTSLLFYLRYRLPFSLLPLAASLVGIVIVQLGFDLLERPAIFIGLGLAVFIVAMAFDINDTERKSHLSDSAFWLHLLAAPLIVHGSMVTMLIEDPAWLQGIDKSILMMLFFTLFFLLALLIDRRALLISTQFYAIYALTRILENQLNHTQNLLMYLMIALALFVIFFGAYWYKTRALLFGVLRQSWINRYVPDLSLRDQPRSLHSAPPDA